MPSLSLKYCMKSKTVVDKPSQQAIHVNSYTQPLSRTCSVTDHPAHCVWKDSEEISSTHITIHCTRIRTGEITGHKLRIYQYYAEIFFPNGHLLERKDKEKTNIKREHKDKEVCRTHSCSTVKRKTHAALSNHLLWFVLSSQLSQLNYHNL
jgi:hypothetical protein